MAGHKEVTKNVMHVKAFSEMKVDETHVLVSYRHAARSIVFDSFIWWQSSDLDQ